MIRWTLVLILFALSLAGLAQVDSLQLDSSKTGKYADVNEFTPWHHLKCVYTTGKETYEDGRSNQKSDHWWSMSYIGRACEAQHGRRTAVIFESIFAVPHYIGVGFANGCGQLVYSVRGPKKSSKE